MKQVIYNGNKGRNIIAGGVSFTAGESVTVNDDELADALLAKSDFSVAPAEKIQAPAYAPKVTPETTPNP